MAHSLHVSTKRRPRMSRSDAPSWPTGNGKRKWAVVGGYGPRRGPVLIRQANGSAHRLNRRGVARYNSGGALLGGRAQLHSQDRGGVHNKGCHHPPHHSRGRLRPLGKYAPLNRPSAKIRSGRDGAKCKREIEDLLAGKVQMPSVTGSNVYEDDTSSGAPGPPAQQLPQPPRAS